MVTTRRKLRVYLNFQVLKYETDAKTLNYLCCSWVPLGGFRKKQWCYIYLHCPRPPHMNLLCLLLDLCALADPTISAATTSVNISFLNPRPHDIQNFIVNIILRRYLIFWPLLICCNYIEVQISGATRYYIGQLILMCLGGCYRVLML